MGATNAGRLLGIRWGLFVGVLDMTKGFAAVFVSNLMSLMVNSGEFEQPVSTLGMIGGIAAMAGHIWPVWLGFRGGRGAATALGVLAAVIPGQMLITAFPAALVMLRTQNTGLGFGCSFIWSLAIAKLFSGLSWVLVAYFSSLFAIVILTDMRLKRRKLRMGSALWQALISSGRRE